MKSISLTLLCALVLLSLAGCPSAPIIQVPPLVESTKTVKLDLRLLTECPVLIKAVDATDDQILAAVESWMKAYDACRINKSKLNAIVKSAFNLKEELPK